MTEQTPAATSNAEPYQTTVPIAFEVRAGGLRVAAIRDPSLLAGARLVLIVQAAMPAAELRAAFAADALVSAHVGSSDVNGAGDPAIPVRALAVVPQELPYLPGANYFEVDRSSPGWPSVVAAEGLALNVTGDLPGLEIECWAIRG